MIETRHGAHEQRGLGVFGRDLQALGLAGGLDGGAAGDGVDGLEGRGGDGLLRRLLRRCEPLLGLEQDALVFFQVAVGGGRFRQGPSPAALARCRR